MLKLYPLFSGSSGNMYLVESHNAKVLVDIGVSYKSLTSSLETLGINISDIDALVITHEHSDHTKGLSTFINKNSTPMFMTQGTYDYLLNKIDGKLRNKPNVTYIHPEDTFSIKDIDITPFKTSHDAVEPVGYTLRSEDSILTIATDLGYVSENVYKHLLNSSFSVIESNYDRNLLLYGSYPYPLQCRIQSDIGHLSNDDTSDTILSLAKQGKRNFLLGHISKNNNEPEQAMFCVQDNLVKNGFNLQDFNISFASRNVSYEVYHL